MYIQLYKNAIKKGHRKKQPLQACIFSYVLFGLYNGIKIYNVNIAKGNKKVKYFLLQIKNINDIIVFFII